MDPPGREKKERKIKKKEKIEETQKSKKAGVVCNKISQCILNFEFETPRKYISIHSMVLKKTGTVALREQKFNQFPFSLCSGAELTGDDFSI